MDPDDDDDFDDPLGRPLSDFILEQIDKIEEKFDDKLEKLEDEFEERVEDLEDTIEDLSDQQEEFVDEGLDRSDPEKYQALCEKIDKLKEERNQLREKYRHDKEALKQTRQQLKEQIKNQIHHIRTQTNLPRDGDGNKDFTRVNFTLPKTMRNDMKDLAKELDVSVSELIRKSMQTFKKELETNLETPIEELSRNLQSVEKDIEKNVRENLQGILKSKENPSSGSTPIKTSTPPLQTPENPSNMGPRDIKEPPMNRLMIGKRIKGMFRMYGGLPLDKLGGVTGLALSELENLIYETLAEDTEGRLKVTMTDNILMLENDSEEIRDYFISLIEKSFK